MSKASHLIFSLNKHFFVTNISSGNPYCWDITVDTLSILGSLFSSIPPYRIVRDSGTWGDWQITSPLLPRLRLGSRASIPIGRGGSGNLFPSHLCPPSSRTCWSPSLGWLVHPLYLFYWFYVPPCIGTSINESKPPPIPSPNEERWITDGSFALVLPLQSFGVAAIQVVAASPTRPRLGVWRL